MRESPIINEWRAEGSVEGTIETRRAVLLELFELRFGQAPPAALVKAVNEEADLEKLSAWFRTLAGVNSPGEFLQQANGRVYPAE